MGDNASIVEKVYEGFSVGDMDKVMSVMAADLIWNEAEGNPYADKNPYQGPEGVLAGLFARLGSEWDGFSATPHNYVTQDHRVVVFGRYGGIYKATGRSQDVPFVHDWTIRDGKIISFQQYTNTAQLASVMGCA